MLLPVTTDVADFVSLGAWIRKIGLKSVAITAISVAIIAVGVHRKRCSTLI